MLFLGFLFVLFFGFLCDFFLFCFVGIFKIFDALAFDSKGFPEK